MKDNIPSWGKDGVYRLQRVGVLNGQNGNCFYPEGTLTKAQTATALWKYYCSTALFRSGLFDAPVPIWVKNAIEKGNKEYGAMSDFEKIAKSSVLTDEWIAAKAAAIAFSALTPVASTYLINFLDMINFVPTDYRKRNARSR